MKPTLAMLLILDGFGYSEETADNAIAMANTPNWGALWHDFPHTLIHASEQSVGLPEGQMGNSEVGHLNIGAGRVVYQDFERINHAIETGEFFANPTLLDAVHKARNGGKALHVFGLLSDGGVHSHEKHIQALVEICARAGLQQVYVHAFLDGRDTPPRSAEQYIRNLEAKCAELKVGRIATIIGRYYAMDRDKRWPRVEVAYRAITDGIGEFSATSAVDALHAAYARGEDDEFVKPTTIVPAGAKPVRVEDGDVIVFMNFRTDRTRELTSAFLDPAFDGFPRQRVPKLAGYYTLTLYSQDFSSAQVIFPPQQIEGSFGEYISGLGLRQLRIAETEKYPHVTFFFNGGEERVYPGEDRILVPSPKVATYDLQPEMSAPEVTDRLEEAILSKKYDVIICNYANPDMVGHTGNLPAAIKAIETVDACLGRVVKAAQKVGGEVLITADHGNAETMRDHVNQQPHTSHTTNLVPFVYVGRAAAIAEPGAGALSDIAPTLLCLMELPQPAQMTGHALVRFGKAATAAAG